ncbi:MAG: hypothetical protein DMF56_22525 [Acidobacteria bacterium]|nr:MAG: hypothetical protein DMF56_22525 [Acidobacteriota bacterium]
MTSRVVPWVVLVLYVAVVAFAAVAHEPWWDEAQAWLLARDAPVSDLVAVHLSYEGHPPLWYLILSIPAKAGLPYGAMKWAAILIALTGVAFLLFRLKNVPLAVRVLVPFSFFVAYQFTVVARSYVLVPPLLWALAAIYDRRARLFPLFVFLLIALSNVSVHGLGIAGGLFLLFLIDLARRRIAFSELSQRAFLGGTLLFALNSVFLIVILWPPVNLKTGPLVDMSFSAERFAEVGLWILREIMWGGLDEMSNAAGIVVLLLLLTAFALLMTFLRRRQALLVFLIPTAAMLPVAALYFGLWHEGLFFFVLLFALFVAWQRTPASPERRSLDFAVLCILSIVLLRHIQWAAQSIRYDATQPFTGSRETAEFIARNHLDQARLFGAGLRCVEIQPYFPHNIFRNYAIPGNAAFWDWSTENPWPLGNAKVTSSREMGQWFYQTMAQRPDFVVAAIGYRMDHLYARALIRRPDYRLIATFSGVTYWKSKQIEIIAFQIFARKRT